MTSRQIRFPSEAIAAVERGNVIVAIKSVRDANRLDLRTAKEAVDAYVAGERGFIIEAFERKAVPADEDTGALPAEAVAALASGKRTEAVKIVRARYGLDLKEAKDRVDAHPHARAVRDAGKIRTSTVERDRMRGGWWLFAGLAFLAVCYLAWQRA